MNPFVYSRMQTLDQTWHAAEAKNARIIAGGTNLLDLMKINVETPTTLIDINALPLQQLTMKDDILEIGALARMSDVASDARVIRHFPVISQALLASASPQLRNMASIGGNVMQRTRCSYFRDIASACNKRQPGSGCAALDGDNRQHAILGISSHCIATHPSDLAVALMAVDARIKMSGPDGEHAVPIDNFYRLPGDSPEIEHNLPSGTVITAIQMPVSSLSMQSGYLKVRDRASFEFALCSAAVALDIAEGKVRAARIALGGVATKPWRAKEAETHLIGKPALEKHFVQAADIALASARPRSDNAYKVILAQRTVARALSTLSEKIAS